MRNELNERWSRVRVSHCMLVLLPISACIILCSWVLFVSLACNWSEHESRSICLVGGPLSSVPSHLRPTTATGSSSIPRLRLSPNITSIPRPRLGSNITFSNLKIQKDKRKRTFSNLKIHQNDIKHTKFVSLSMSSQLEATATSYTRATSALDHFAMFPQGTWKKSQDNASTLPLYDPMKCARTLNRSCFWDPPKKFFERALGSWSWKGSGVVSKAVEEYSMLDRSRLHDIVTNRQFIFVGDSLAGEDHLSFQLLMLCHEGGTDACIDAHDPLLLHLPSLGASLKRFSSPFLPIGNAEKVAAANESYWIDEQGNKVKMKAQNSSHLIDLDKELIINDDFKRYASLPHVVMVINVGHWFASFRSDVHFKRKGQSFRNKFRRLATLSVIARFVAHFLNVTLADGGLVIWRGYSPGINDADQCHQKQMHQVTKAIYMGIESYLGPRQLFIDTGCAFRGPGTFWTRDGNHFILPGPPDLGHLFTFRILKELLARGGLKPAQSSELQCTNACKAV